jgi:hypothetical protein
MHANQLLEQMTSFISLTVGRKSRVLINSSFFKIVFAKGVGRGPTLAWPGWKQPDISVKVDTARLEAGQFKKCCMECVELYYPSTEFQSTFNVY